MMDYAIFKRLMGSEAVIKIARMLVRSPPRSAQSVRLLSKLKEKIEELDREEQKRE